MRLAIALALLLAAGCLAPAATRPTSTGATLPYDPMGQAHDHSDVALHDFSWQMAQTDHQPLAGSATHGSGAHALDVRNGWLFAAVYGGTADDEGGFFVLNLSDPAHPRQVGRYQFPGPLAGDRSMEATDDADFVALGTEAVDCAGHVNPAGPGLYLIDVRDKANPRLADYMPNSGVHSVTVHRIHGEDYVFGLMPNDNVVHIVRSPVPRLEAVGQVSIGHDSIVVDDPILQKPLLYAANGGAGFEISDVSDPGHPKLLAAWNIPDRNGKYYIHTGAVTSVDGRRIAVVTSEDWQDYPSALWVLDATDFGLIQTISHWSAPGDHAADGLRYSMHNPRFLGTTLILAYYHGGVWALDMGSAQKLAHPQVIGQFSPSTSNGWRPQPTDTHAVSDTECGKFNLADAPMVFDVETGPQGYVYVADLPTGLYTVKPTW
ncbi:MAG: hypothetical protein QOE90_2008 [Thermoplasmata archaeon]|nr:hypothetical protein [Thermoplasmata archaeon]